MVILADRDVSHGVDEGQRPEIILELERRDELLRGGIELPFLAQVFFQRAALRGAERLGVAFARNAAAFGESVRGFGHWGVSIQGFDVSTIDFFAIADAHDDDQDFAVTDVGNHALVADSI